MARPPFKVKAQFEYSSPHEDDLSFPNGQLITVTDLEGDEWYYGEFEDENGNKNEGLFPKNFVKAYEPETPPRPSRSARTKRDSEPAPSATNIGESRVSKETDGPALEIEPETSSKAATTFQVQKKLEEDDVIISPPSRRSTSEQPAAASAAAPSNKPQPAATSKAAPPPPAEKPSSSSFRDRINAFNKTSAAPLAPAKPSGLASAGGSGFVKKTFVAPPPSKNAYVPPPQAPPPQKVYRREEDPTLPATLQAEDDEQEQEPTRGPGPESEAATEEQPKPTSLKDRIALLQKQQMEQAARHAEKKDKAKRPPKSTEEEPQGLDQEVGSLDSVQIFESSEAPAKKSSESTRTKSRILQHDPNMGGSGTIPPRELLSDGNDADQSGAGDTEGEEFSTSRDDSDEKANKRPSIPRLGSAGSENQGANESNADEKEEEDEEEEMDPEVKRRMELRDRMAKMSGGMGMAGMFGPPGGLPPRTPAKHGTPSSNRKSSQEVRSSSEAQAAYAPSAPMVPMPGLVKVSSPEQVQAPSKEKHDIGRVREQIGVSVESSEEKEEQEEDLKVLSSGASTDRAPPPPPPSSSKCSPPELLNPC